MAHAHILVMNLSDFRRMDSLSGVMRVVGGSRWRRGARRHAWPASCNSLKETAGTDAACAAAAGESAHPSAAHAASRDTDADLASPRAEDADDASDKKTKSNNSKPNNSKDAPAKDDKPAARKGDGGDGPIESLWQERTQLDGGDPLPDDGVGFVDAVNDHIDLVRTTELLLRGFDEKSTKNLLEMLLEMKYGKNARSTASRTPSLADCVPQAIRD